MKHKNLKLGDWWDRYTSLFVNPGLYFHDIRKETGESGQKRVLWFVAILSLVVAALGYLLSLPSFLGSVDVPQSQLIFSGLMILFEPLFTLLAVLLLSGVAYLLFSWIYKDASFESIVKVVGYSRMIAVPYTLASALLFLIFELIYPGNVYTLFASGSGIFESPALIVLFVLSGLLSIASFVHVLYAMISGINLLYETDTWKVFALILLASVVSVFVILLLSGIVSAGIFASISAIL